MTDNKQQPTAGLHVVGLEDVGGEHVVLVPGVAHEPTHHLATVDAHSHLHTLAPACKHGEGSLLTIGDGHGGQAT